MKSVDIVYFDAGSGHRSAAFALKRVLSAAHPDWRIRSVNLLDILAFDQPFHRMVRVGINYFNWNLKHEYFFDLTGLVRLSLVIQDRVRQAQIERIAEFWRTAPPDTVVSVTPMYNPVLYRSAHLANPNVVCITIPVDFEEIRTRYWFTPKLPDQHYLISTDALDLQARQAGILESHRHRIGGMIIDPAFYTPPPANILDEIARLGLDPSLPTGLVSFGGQGSVVVSRIAERIHAACLPVNMIYLCGRNEAVYERVKASASHFPKLVLQYSDAPPSYYHHLADFLIGKPGSMTLTEALVTETPFIFIKARALAPVQRGNERWILDHETGVRANRVRVLTPAVQQVLNDTQHYRRQAEQHYHRGVFDAAAVIAQLMA
ncbi:MAG: hypothetical protein ABI700_18520 [Chloroflexota bacterium]